MNIPVPTNTFDGAISIAVIHHMSTEVRKNFKNKKSFFFLFLESTINSFTRNCSNIKTRWSSISYCMGKRTRNRE
jgi:hypothetical protein